MTAAGDATRPRVMLRHGRVDLALHTLRDGRAADVHALLLLHGLGERSPAEVPAEVAGWPGAVHALDFTGHGDSTVPDGGGYTSEMLMADVDAAIAHLGPVTIVGRGIGAYIAMLIAGGRPADVRGAVLLDGPGLIGGGSTPTSPHVESVDADAVAPPDPWALAELTRDPRPPDYATAFVRQAVHFSGLAEPVTVCAIGRPPWLEAVVDEPGVRVARLSDALEAYSSV
ncbi:MAG TPA: alpha/beta hydrolase [Acidimicrobiales bacterium]|nr:alpha/beta hydrolase [Acidimicrobiales bacterium]